MKLYVCNEDGSNSALYQKRCRQVVWQGNCGPVSFPLTWTVVEYRRITNPKGRYLTPKSDWFKPTYSNEKKAIIDSYSKLGCVRTLLERGKHKLSELAESLEKKWTCRNGVP